MDNLLTLKSDSDLKNLVLLYFLRKFLPTLQFPDEPSAMTYSNFSVIMKFEMLTDRKLSLHKKQPSFSEGTSRQFHAKFSLRLGNKGHSLFWLGPPVHWEACWARLPQLWTWWTRCFWLQAPIHQVPGCGSPVALCHSPEKERDGGTHWGPARPREASVSEYEVTTILNGLLSTPHFALIDEVIKCQYRQPWNLRRPGYQRIVHKSANFSMTTCRRSQKPPWSWRSSCIFPGHALGLQLHSKDSWSALITALCAQGRGTTPPPY